MLHDEPRPIVLLEAGKPAALIAGDCIRALRDAGASGLHIDNMRFEIHEIQNSNYDQTLAILNRYCELIK